ncbi:FHA domain-containing protein DDL [Camellia lanceoleosa]|uniref:FHA domain-containing protein DDL n=1 Tax=Camellia lanceoleosa TaxID=1840588 RepID=A0ACC0F3X8_9ERIC|nr:FHA domain-containing protein DDL [Camellia lanceoleosa]
MPFSQWLCETSENSLRFNFSASYVMISELCLRNGDDDSVAKMKATEDALQEKEKQKPSFELSGKLAAETNRVRGDNLIAFILG